MNFFSFISQSYDGSFTSSEEHKTEMNPRFMKSVEEFLHVFIGFSAVDKM